MPVALFKSVHELKAFLDSKVEQYNQPGFIENDPICIPHQFTKLQDIEIMGFWASVLAWGQRKTIINKCNLLISLMDGAPHDFILNHQPADLKRFLGFKHRTFNDTDTLYFIEFFKHHFSQNDSLESAFTGARQVLSPFRPEFSGNSISQEIESASAPCFLGDLSSTENIKAVENSLNHFRRYFSSLPDFPGRTLKHISSPLQNSACKRLNMFLRWMVRVDDRGVDFGLWKSLHPSQLICPTDVHVERVSRKLNLISRKQVDWKTALELTQNLRLLDPSDPVKYDFALFGLGIEEQFQKY